VMRLLVNQVREPCVLPSYRLPSCLRPGAYLAKVAGFMADAAGRGAQLVVFQRRLSRPIHVG